VTLVEMYWMLEASIVSTGIFMLLYIRYLEYVLYASMRA
jgi:hypothetical protein